MKILFYSWTEGSDTDLEDGFNQLGYSYTEIPYRMDDFDDDPVFENNICQMLSAENYDCIFTFNYFPLLSKIANEHTIPYVSWVYDCPHLTLFSNTITNTCNYLFLFDKNLMQTVQILGAKHAYHLPLAVNTQRINTQLQLPKVMDSFDYDVSFVGNLYDNNMYDKINYLPPILHEYFNGLMQAQQKIWGYNFIHEALNEAMITQALTYIKLGNDSRYSFTPRDIFANMLNAKLTCTERVSMLTSIAKQFSLDVFSNSALILENAIMHGTVSYRNEMPVVFHRSKINLNISLRSIYSGIPLRCMDILGRRGFLLTNYQPELVEFFVPDEEFVYFDSPDDLLDKTAYYLSNPQKRIEIAHNGWEKIQKHFSYEIQLQKIFKELPI